MIFCSTQSRKQSPAQVEQKKNLSLCALSNPQLTERLPNLSLGLFPGLHLEPYALFPE